MDTDSTADVTRTNVTNPGVQVEALPARFRLRAVEGPDRGTTFMLRAPQTIVGREDPELAGRGARIELWDGRCSRRHLMLVRRAEGPDRERLFAIDLGSKNGTEINGDRLVAAEHEVNDGDRIGLGRTVLVVEHSGRATGPEALNEASTDPVSGLFTRAHIERELHQRSLEPTPFGLIWLGLSAGDEASARKAAGALRETLGDTEVCAHLGSGEILILLPGARLEGARRIADLAAAAIERVGVESVAACLAHPDHGVAEGQLVASLEHAKAIARTTGPKTIPSNAPKNSVAVLLSRLERAAILFAARRGVGVVRIALGIVFVWFGALKVTDTSPVADLVASVMRPVPRELALPVLGGVEVLLGAALMLKVALRLTMVLFFLHMPGTFLVLLVHPELAFQEGNLLLLTVTGEFVVKNLVLIASGLLIVATVRRRDEHLWLRRSDG